MANNIQVLVNTGNPDNNKTVEVLQGSGKRGKPTTIKAVKGARYQLEEQTAKNTAPENIRSKRVGKNLHVMLNGSKEADLIIENYYDEEMLSENNRGLYGRAEDGKIYEYIPEDPTREGMPINLADGGRPVSQVLGGLQVGEAFELSGLLLAAAGGGFSALTAGAAVVGGAALAGGGGGGGGGGTDPAVAALASIKAAAENNTATSGNLAASVFTAAGVTGVDASNLAAIQSALDTAAVNGNAADTKEEVQAIVDAYNAIKANADGTANNYATNPTQAQYTAIGVTGVDTATEESLLGDAIDGKPFSAVDTVAEVQTLANAASAVMTGAAGGTAPTKAQLEALGITGVTDANLSAIQAAIAATPDNGTGVDTLGELQAVANTGATNAANAAAALSAIAAAAQANDATDANVAASVFATAGVTGVDSSNVAAIQSALNSAAVVGTSADTLAEVQAIVDAYNAIKANADGAANNNATNPTAAQYAAIGVTGVDSNVKTSLLGDVVDAKPFSAVDTVSEVQTLADAAAAVMTAAAGPTSGNAPTRAQLEALGITGVTDANLQYVQDSIARTADDGIGVDTLAELQAVVTIGIDAAAAAAAAAAAIAAISAAAQANNATDANVAASVFATAGVTGVDSTNVAAIQSALNSAAVNGAATDTLVEIQNIVNAYNAIRENADGTANNYANNPTQAQYALIGVTGVNSSEKESLLGDAIDGKPFSAVDSVPEVQALADAAAAVIASTTGGTAPTQAQLTALGITGVTSTNLAAVQAAIAANGSGAAGVDTLTELQTVVTNAAAAAAALDAIKTAAENNSAGTTPSVADFATAGITGVDANNLAAISSALNSSVVNGAAADTKPEVQAIVDAYNAIKANADGTAANYTTNPTQAQYAAIGVTGVDSAVKESLLGDAIDGKAFADVDTVAEVQALADAAAAVMSGAAGGAAPTKEQLAALGITGVTPANLAAVQAAIAATTDNGTAVDTLSELQTVVTNAVNAAAATTAALDTIKAAAEANTAASGNLAASVFATAGVTGVDANNLSAIQSALDSAAVNGVAADTTAEVQAIVDAYNAIKANADGTAANYATNPSQAQYAAIGVTGVNSATKESLLGDVVDAKPFTAVDTVGELQTLADAAAAVMAGAASSTTPAAPTKVQLEALGITGVTDANLSAIQAAIAATADDGTGVDTLAELQAVANAGATNAANAAAIAAALSTIAAAAQANNASNTNVPASVFATAGVTGVDANNVAAIQSALNDSDVQSAQADTTAKVQAVVDAYNAIKANADTASTANATQAQYAAIGVNGIDNAAKTSLLGDVVDTKAFADVDTVGELQALADLAATVINAAAAGTAPTKAQLEALGITGVTDANLSAIQAAIAATPDDGTGVDTLAELQAVATAGATNAANAAAAAAALSTIAAAAQANDATNTNVPYTLFATAGVTGVDSTNVAAIQSALNSAAVVGTSVDTLGEVQAVVDAYKAILAEANDTANTAGNGTPDANPASNPTAAQYAAIGVNLGSATTDAATDPETLGLLNAIVGGKQTADVDTVAEVQALATIANAIQLKAAGGTPSPALTIADLQKIGLDTTGVTTDNLPTLLAAIAAKSDTGSETDTLEKLQALITNLDKVVPVAVADTATLTENFVLSNGNLSTNDTSLDGSETYSLVGSGTGTYAAIALTMTNGVYAGGYILSPNTGTIHAITTNVTDTFTYRVTDAAGNTSTNTVTFTFTPVNTAPVNTVPLTTQTLNEDATQVISGLSMADVDANGASETVTLAVAHGTITVAAGAGVTLGTNGTGSVSLSGTVSAINTLLATANAVTYAPTANYNGSDTLTMTTNDGGNTGSGGALSDVDTVAITVNAVNDTPTGAVTISGSTAVGSVLTASSSVADVDGLGTLSYSWYANGTAISGATGTTYTLASGDAGKTITAKVSYTDGGGTAETVTSSATAAVTAVTPGQSVIDLGASGKLIAPIQVEGKWYYTWDRSGNSASDSTDTVTHDVLDTIFKYDINGNLNPNSGTDTNDVYRYATINGVQVALPTINGNILSYGGAPVGTSANGGGLTNNSSYDDMLAIWDNTNGTTTASMRPGFPTGWGSNTGAVSAYWTSTLLSAGHHELIALDDGSTGLGNYLDTYSAYVALQVVAANAAPVLDAAASPTLTGVSAGAAAPVNGTTTGSDLVSSLVAGITDADSGASKGIAITGVHAGATLYYSTNGGTTWLTATSVSDTNALLLAADSDTRVYYQANGTSGTFTDAITFRAWDMTANITEGVYTDTTPRGGKAQFSTASDTVAVTSTVTAGQSVVDLGTGNGKLIAPIQVGGDWFYYWDRSGDGTNADSGTANGGVDWTSHNVLDAIFNKDINGVTNTSVLNADGLYGTTDVYRYATINGVLLTLPTVGTTSTTTYYAPGTAVTNNTTTVNSTYGNTLLGVWDAGNGTSTSTSISGVPTGWYASTYWTATPTNLGHAVVNLNYGYVTDPADPNNQYVALQMVKVNTAPVLDAAQSPTLTSVSASAAVPTGVTGDLVSSLVTGISDADSGAAKGIAITGVHSGGTLYYSLNGGTTWTAASGLSSTNALLLAADSDTRVFYQANGTSGTITDAITFRAWDETQHAAEGVYADTSSNGGKAEFSTATDTVSISVTDPLIATIMNIEVKVIANPSAVGGVFAYITGTPTPGTGDTTTLHNATTGAVVYTSPGWAPGASSLNFTGTSFASGDKFYVQLNTAGGQSYRLKNSVVYNGPSSPATQVDFLTSPLVLDLNGDGVQTTDTAHGVQFDLSNSGTPQRTSWVEKHDGLLAIDLNGDGQINSGAELLGSSTQLANGSLASDGWAALGAMDTNGDGKVDAQDANFDKLRVWVDANGDGVTDAGELKTLADVHIASFNVAHDSSVTQQNGNVLQGVAKYTTTDGVTHDMADAWLQATPLSVMTLSHGASLDLSNVSNLSSVTGVNMSADTAANTVKLTLADVLSVATDASIANGVHKLTLTGDANDTVELDLSQWANTGTTVTEGDHTYAVYNAAASAAAQLLIDQHMVLANHG